MKVKIQYRDKNLEIVNIEEYHLSDYCHLLSQRSLSLLYQIEDLMNGKLGYAEVNILYSTSPEKFRGCLRIYRMSHRQKILK